MYYVIAFDIKNNKTRRQVADLLLGYGDRVQYSIFECMLSRSQLKKLQQQIRKKITIKTDRIAYYPLCGRDIAERKADGRGLVIWPPQFTLDID